MQLKYHENIFTRDWHTNVGVSTKTKCMWLHWSFCSTEETQNTRSVWITKETKTFLRLMHQTNLNVIFPSCLPHCSPPFKVWLVFWVHYLVSLSSAIVWWHMTGEFMPSASATSKSQNQIDIFGKRKNAWENSIIMRYYITTLRKRTACTEF